MIAYMIKLIKWFKIALGRDDVREKVMVLVHGARKIFLKRCSRFFHQFYFINREYLI